jgi:hypothetical protein
MGTLRGDLQPGTSMGRDESLLSPCGAFRLVLQGADGNLVLYAIDDVHLPWMQPPSGDPIPDIEKSVQSNLYTTPLWASGTQGSDAHHWTMQTDGNLVLYDPTQSHALWSSGTQGNDGAFLRCQDDGNLVVYGTNGQALWSSNTQAGPR